MRYERFVRSSERCPSCEGNAIEDRWPPNYGGGSVMTTFDGRTVGGESHATVKYVCWDCHVQWAVFSKTTYSEEGPTEARKVIGLAPLVERGGKWLTKHDLWREDYLERHGEYPRESYA